MLQHHDGELAAVTFAGKASTDGFDVEKHVYDAIIEVVGSESPRKIRRTAKTAPVALDRGDATANLKTQGDRMTETSIDTSE